MVPAVVVGDVCTGTRDEVSRNILNVRSRLSVAPRAEPMETNPISSVCPGYASTAHRAATIAITVTRSNLE
jgi:hypothetical protein